MAVKTMAFIALLTLTFGCQPKGGISVDVKRLGGADSTFKITKRTPLVVKSGDKLSLSGEGFQPGISLALAGNAVGTVEVADAQSALWTVPAGLSGGVLRLTATQGGATQDISVIYQPGDGSVPVITKSPSGVCSGEQFYDAQGTLQTGTADCSGGSDAGDSGSSYQDDMKSTAHRTVNTDQVSLTTEITTGLTSDYRRVPDVFTDDDGHDASSPVVKQARPGSNCGTSGTIEERITACNATWSGKANGTSGEGDWKLVTRLDSPGVYEVWRDERTGLLWSDRVGDSTSSIDPDSNDFTANWCQASGNAQLDNLNNYCTNGTYQNQTTPESWCGNADTGAAMKGNIGSAENIIWRLPTIYDWKQADVNGIRFVLPNMNYWFWSASVVSYNRSSARQFYGDSGDVDNSNRDSGYAVRCIGSR